MKLFTDFTPASHEDWRRAVDKELKGLSFEDTLRSFDPIEGIDFSKFDDTPIDTSSSTLNYSRSSRLENNDWLMGISIDVKDEKIANQEALTALNQGANSLTFVLHKKNILWEALFQEIGLDFIEVQFKTTDEAQFDELSSRYSEFSKKPLVVVNDWLIHKHNPSKPTVQFAINGFGIHQAGANATQEIAFALSAGHACLFHLLEKGFSIDQASKMLRFELGIGANYFIEVTKFKVFRKLWANIVDAYNPKENASHSCYIYAKTGFVNKSLNDPYTNLLRQTTEAMSAILGGVDEIQIQAYDKFAIGADRTLSERMALNISNLLKEESYFDKVIDPLGGSYSLDNLSQTLEKQAWGMFLEMENLGGISTEKADHWLRNEIVKTAEIRKEQINNGNHILIGINKFPNPEISALEWMELPSYFDLPALILEKK